MPLYNSEKWCKSNTRYPKHSAPEFSAGFSTTDLSHLSQLYQGLLMSRTDLCQGPFKTFVYQVWGLFFFHSEKLSSFIFLICTDCYTISFLLIWYLSTGDFRAALGPECSWELVSLPCCCSWKTLVCGANHYPNSALCFKTVSVLDWDAKYKSFEKWSSQ